MTTFVPRGKIQARLDVVRVHAIGGPDPARLLRLIRPCIDRHLRAHHESGVKSDSELTDKARIAGVLPNLLEKCLGAGMGNRSEIFDEFVTRHPDAGISYRNGMSAVVSANRNRERTVRLEDVGTGGLQKS